MMMMDPEWNPSVLVARRLRDAAATHASCLAERTTVESSLCAGPGDGGDDAPSAAAADGGGARPLSELALERSSCPQPPLDDGITGGGSSVPFDVHFSGMNVRLDPLKRCAPHRIVVPQPQAEGEGGGSDCGVRGEVDGAYAYDAKLGERRSATWNAITALATLC